MSCYDISWSAGPGTDPEVAHRRQSQSSIYILLVDTGDAHPNRLLQSRITCYPMAAPILPRQAVCDVRDTSGRQRKSGDIRDLNRLQKNTTICVLSTFG